jgi:predicted P-loop ATPase
VLGYVYRFVTSEGGKEVLPLTWCEHDTSHKRDWRWMQWTVPRPLYGLDRLTVADVDHPRHKAPVLIVEGEKCADAAESVYPDRACLTWSGGCKAVDKADWQALSGRAVWIWPDCDSQKDKSGQFLPYDAQPGQVAAAKIAKILLGFGCQVSIVRVPEPGEVKSGWDIADALQEWPVEQVLSYAQAHLQALETAKSVENRRENPANAGGGGSGDDSARKEPMGDAEPDRAWFHALTKKARGGIEPCRSNVAKILRMHPELRGAIGYNEFSHQVEKLRPTPWSDAIGAWENSDDSELDEWLVDKIEVLIKSLATIAEGVSHAANAHRFHPVKEYLEGLPDWDGKPRLDYYLSYITDNAQTDFLRLAGRFFLIAMVARIFRPGVKFDYMLVLEGKQGQGKSSFFRILADPWFSETPFEIGTNEGNMAIQGVWLQEMAEMGMFSRSEDTAFKSFLAITKDKFRRPYDRRPIEVPRVCMFGGTTNLDQYLKDQTGNRRIWPVRCTEVDNEWLRLNREQLFAEAIIAFRAGERFYPTPQEEALYFEPEQRTRLSVDAWEETIALFVGDPKEKLTNFYTALDLLIKACGMERSKIDEANRATSRVGRIMVKLGWERVREPTGHYRRWGYVRPEKERIRAEIFSPAPDDDD